MADILLRERIKLLARSLDTVDRVIEALENSRRVADVPPAAAATVQLVALANKRVEIMRDTSQTATFLAGESQGLFEEALAGLGAFLRAMEKGMTTPAARPRVEVRIKRLVSNLADAVKERRDALDDLREEAEEADGKGDGDAAARAARWQRFLELEAQCRRLFVDYLDLLRGIALRDSGLDDGLCRIADGLVGELDTFGKAPWESITIPAGQELRDDPVTGFVRIGFPEWSVWTLPLTAVEFASFLIVQHPNTAKSRAESEAQLAALVDGGLVIPDDALVSMIDRLGLPADPALRAPLVREALHRLAGMITLECVATALMGPAYAWSALLMRVDPLSGHPLVERLRRQAVVSTLELLEERGRTASRTDLLEAEWTALLDSAGSWPPNEIDAALEPIVTEAAKGAVERDPNPMYEGDWVVIVALADRLLQDLDPAAVVAEVTAANNLSPTLRHVVNAGWVARLAQPNADAYEGNGAAPPEPSPLSRMVLGVAEAVLAGGGEVATSGRPGLGLNPTLPGAGP